MQCINEDVVEKHIQHTQQHTHDAGQLHVAGRLEHGTRQIEQQNEWHCTRKDEKILRSTVNNIGTTAQPQWNGPMEQHAN